jgi:hypothetical protein
MMIHRGIMIHPGPGDNLMPIPDGLESLFDPTYFQSLHRRNAGDKPDACLDIAPNRVRRYAPIGLGGNGSTDNDAFRA